MAPPEPHLEVGCGGKEIATQDSPLLAISCIHEKMRARGCIPAHTGRLSGVYGHPQVMAREIPPLEEQFNLIKRRLQDQFWCNKLG